MTFIGNPEESEDEVSRPALSSSARVHPAPAALFLSAFPLPRP